MKQLAWLDFYRGRWHLATSNIRDPIRRWTDKETALSELANEGWTISGPHPRQLSVKRLQGKGFYGFALTRMVH